MTATRPAPPLPTLERAVLCAAREFDRRRRPEKRDEALLWRSLVGCLVGSAQRFEQGLSATRRVCEIIDRPWEIKTDDFGSLESVLYGALAEQRVDSVRPRFPAVHAAQITAAVRLLYVEGDGLGGLIGSGDGPSARRTLVHLIPGLGPKQASLFLRNSGLSADIAVLDRHVLRYMDWVGVGGSRWPPRDLSEYERLEVALRAHALSFGYDLATFDLAVWVTVRVWGEVQH